MTVATDFVPISFRCYGKPVRGIFLHLFNARNQKVSGAPERRDVNLGTGTLTLSGRKFNLMEFN